MNTFISVPLFLPLLGDMIGHVCWLVCSFDNVLGAEYLLNGWQ